MYRSGSRSFTVGLSKWLAITISLSLGVMLLFSGSQHQKNQYIFLVAVARYRLLPPTLASMAATLIPNLELAIGTCLFFKQTRQTGLISASLLLGSFAFAHLFALVNGLEISCGCFGPTYESTVSALSFSLVAILAAASTLGYIILARTVKENYHE